MVFSTGITGAGAGLGVAATHWVDVGGVLADGVGGMPDEGGGVETAEEATAASVAGRADGGVGRPCAAVVTGVSAAGGAGGGAGRAGAAVMTGASVADAAA